MQVNVQNFPNQRIHSAINDTTVGNCSQVSTYEKFKAVNVYLIIIYFDLAQQICEASQITRQDKDTSNNPWQDFDLYLRNKIRNQICTNTYFYVFHKSSVLISLRWANIPQDSSMCQTGALFGKGNTANFFNAPNEYHFM